MLSVTLSKGLLWQESLDRLVIILLLRTKHGGWNSFWSSSSSDAPAKCWWNTDKVSNFLAILIVMIQKVLNVCDTVSPGPPPFGSSWVKRYSTFVKEQKILHMVTFDHRSGGKIVSSHITHIENTFQNNMLFFWFFFCHCNILYSKVCFFVFRVRRSLSRSNPVSAKRQTCWTGGSA